MNVTTITLKNYRHIITDLIKLIGDIPVQELNEQVITTYTERLMLRITNFRTIASYLRNVRVFVNWLIKTEKIAPFKITLPKTEKVPKEPYTEAELKRLLVQPSKKRFCEYRNWVAINILIGTGCRRRSLLNIKIQDLDLFNQHITFRVTKNKYALIVPMSDTLSCILKEYVKARKAQPDDYLICNAFGEKMKDNGFTHEIEKYNRSRGVEKTSVHLFRHTFAIMYLRANGNVVFLSRILGHRDINTTMQYVSLVISDLKLNFNQVSPLEQLNQKRRHISME
jgi:integrase/recombinase XerD